MTNDADLYPRLERIIGRRGVVSDESQRLHVKDLEKQVATLLLV